jgi:hypothetical protein
MAISTVKNDNSFKINQVVGSCALEGIVVSSDIKEKVSDIIAGRTSLSSAKAVLLAKYSKR